MTLALLTTFASISFAAEKLLQVSTIQALLNGVFEKAVTADYSNKNSDIGLGAGVGLGEVVQLNGICYEADSTGVLTVMPKDEGISYFTGAKFNQKKTNTFKLENLKNSNDIQSAIDNKIVSLKGENVFYVMIITGTFETVDARSEIVPNTENFKPIAQWMKEYQTKFTFTGEKAVGKVIGIKSPYFMNDIGVYPYHFHYISNDNKWGGHILDFSIKDAELKILPINEMKLILPDSKAYLNTYMKLNAGASFKKLETK